MVSCIAEDKIKFPCCICTTMGLVQFGNKIIAVLESYMFDKKCSLSAT